MIWKAIFALLLVIAGIYLYLKLVQKLIPLLLKVFPKNPFAKLGYKKEPSIVMSVQNMCYIDESTKIVSLRHGQNSYILAVGKNDICLIDKLVNTDEGKE